MNKEISSESSGELGPDVSEINYTNYIINGILIQSVYVLFKYIFKVYTFISI